MRRWWRFVGWAIVAALVAAIGVSYVRPWSVLIERGETDFLHVKLSDGNLCAVWVWVEPTASSIRERPIDHLIRRWEAARATPWDRFNVTGTLVFADTQFKERGFSCTLFVPLGVVCAVQAAFWVRRRYRGRWWLAVSEALFPTIVGRHGVILALCRRATIGLLAAVSVLAAAVWITSYTGLPGDAPDFLLLGPPNVVRAAPREGPGPAGVEWSFDYAFVARNGRAEVTYRECVVFTSVRPISSMASRAGGFESFFSRDIPLGRDEQAVNAPARGCMGVGNLLEMCGPDPDTVPAIELNHTLRAPCWAVLALFAPWPTVAFFRGPWRRAGRRVRGLCAVCEYDLQGSVSAVCPECGTAVPGRARWRSAGDGASALRAEKTVIETGASTRD